MINIRRLSCLSPHVYHDKHTPECCKTTDPCRWVLYIPPIRRPGAQCGGTWAVNYGTNSSLHPGDPSAWSTIGVSHTMAGQINCIAW